MQEDGGGKVVLASLQASEEELCHDSGTVDLFPRLLEQLVDDAGLVFVFLLQPGRLGVWGVPDGDRDACAHEFTPEGVGEVSDGSLGGAITGKSCHRTYVYHGRDEGNVSRASFKHSRYECVSDVVAAEVVDLHHTQRRAEAPRESCARGQAITDTYEAVNTSMPFDSSVTDFT